MRKIVIYNINIMLKYFNSFASKIKNCSAFSFGSKNQNHYGNFCIISKN